MKIIFFGTSNVALPVLENLSRHHEICAVVTSPDTKSGRKQEIKESPVSVLAGEMKLKVLKPQTVKNNDLFRLELESLGADIFVVVSYGKILPPEIINMPKHKTVNVHFSLLPKYRGASPIQSALLNGEAKTGTSIFVLDEKMDTGQILKQEEISIDPDDNFLSLSQKLAMHSARIIDETITAYAGGLIVPKPQDDSAATYTKIFSKTDGKIDWSKTAQDIYNQFRAFYPWPGIWTKWNGKIFKITDCACLASSVPAKEPGTVLENGIVSCGQNTMLELRTVQLEGKNVTDIRNFLNGYPNFVGSVLE